MPNLKYVSVEANSENTDGICTVLYFDDAANREEIEKCLQYVKEHRSKFTDAPLVVAVDEYFDYKERATALSTQACWRRYECYGSC